MKTRKLFTRAIAVVACLLLFSTNVLAAEITIGTEATTVGEQAAIKATIGGDTEGWVTFYAVKAGEEFPSDPAEISAFADKVQYVDQFQATEFPKVINIVPRSNSIEKMDLYAFGNGLTAKVAKSGVRMVEAFELTELPTTDDTFHVYTGAVESATPEELKAFFVAAGDIKLKHYAVGQADDTADIIELDENNQHLFTFDVGDINIGKKYRIEVTYNSTPVAGYITLVEPNVPETLTLENADTVFNAYYNGDTPELSVAEMINAVTNNTNDINENKNLTIKATYASDPDAVIELDDEELALDITAEAGNIYGKDYTHKVQPELFGVATADPIYFNLAKREIVGATADNVTMSVFQGITVDAAYIKDNIPPTSLNFKFTWSDPKTVEPNAVSPADITFVIDGDPVENVYTVNATANDANGTPRTVSFELTINITTKTSVNGTVKAYDNIGQTTDEFSNAVPVGAVVTAIPYNAGIVGNFRGTSEGFMPVSTVVNDTTGEFELELDPDTKYTLIVSHTKYVVKNIGTVNQEVYVANSILDNSTLQIINPIGQDALSLGVINLRYAYMGDIDADGTIDTVEADFIRGQFGSTVPAISGGSVGGGAGGGGGASATPGV